MLIAVLAPISEAVLMAYLHLWSYSRPDITIDILGHREGLVSWVVWCYFAFASPQFLMNRFAAKRLGVIRREDFSTTAAGN